MPIGQRLALQRMVDDFTKAGKRAVVFICEHTVRDANKPVIAAWCTVREVYYGSERIWRQLGTKITVKQAIQNFQKSNQV